MLVGGESRIPETVFLEFPFFLLGCRSSFVQYRIDLRGRPGEAGTVG